MKSYWVKAKSTLTTPGTTGKRVKQKEGEDHDCLFLPQPLRWYSALLVGMFYAQRVNAGEIDFPIDTIF